MADNLSVAVLNQNDPETVRDGAPAYLLLLDSFLEGSPDDPDLIFFTDDIEEAKAHLKRHAVRQFGLRRKQMPKASKWLGEKGL